MKSAVTLDAIDCKILQFLQTDAEMSVADIAEAIGLTSTPCWRRIQRLKEAGIIRRQVMLLDADKINVGVTVFVSIRTRSHSDAWFQEFKATVEAIPQVVEFYRMSGDVDYLLRVVVPDIKSYDAVYKRLTRDGDLMDVTSSFSMEEIKFTTALPLAYVNG